MWEIAGGTFVFTEAVRVSFVNGVTSRYTAPVEYQSDIDSLYCDSRLNHTDL